MYHSIITRFLIAWILIIVFNATADVCHAAEHIPLKAKIALNKAHKYYEKNEIEKAIQVLQRYSEKSSRRKAPNYFTIEASLGNYLAVSKRYDEAAVHFENAAKLQPENSSARLNLAICKYELKQYLQAASAFIHSYETSTEKRGKHLYYAAVCYMSADDYLNALSVFERLFSAHSSEIPLSWKESLVHVYFSLGRYRSALPLIEELAENSLDAVRMRWQEILLYQYINLNMTQKALNYADRLVGEYPLEPKWWKTLSTLHLKENRLKRSLTALSVYAYLSPPTTEEKQLIGDLYLTLGIPRQSAEFFKKALEDEKELSLVKKLAYSYMRLNLTKEALTWVEEGLSMKTGDPDLLMLKGKLLYDLENFSEAADTYEQAANVSKKPGRAWLMLGYAAWRAGQIHRAKKALNMCARFSDQKQTAFQLLKAMKDS
jgi:tetratricopeptide (TPR) repeat protein